MIQLPDCESTRLIFDNGVTVTKASEKKYGYVFLQREKKHHDWGCIAFFWCAGDACQRNAEIYFSQNGYIETDYKLQSIVDMRTWNGYQETYAKRKAAKQIKTRK